jgi:large subunit ribosomal protein L17
MRHRVSFRKLSRTHEHRRALLRNLVTSLFLHERIETTVAKAKEARRVAERMITFAKRGDLSARRHVDSYVFDAAATRKLFDTIAPWYAERQGGYTRIIRIGRRLGDAGEMAIFELVKTVEQKAEDRKRRIEAAEAKEAAKAGNAAGGGPGRKKGKAADEDAEAEGDEAAAAEGGKKKKAGASKGRAKTAAGAGAAAPGKGGGKSKAGGGKAGGGAAKAPSKTGRTKRGGEG